MNVLFKREIEVVTDEKIFSGDDYSIFFEVPFDDGSKPNISTISIYNLSDSTVTELKTGSKITLNAGYQNDVGSIFLGSIKFNASEWKGVDRITELDCFDSGETWFEKSIKKTYKAGASGKQILKDLLKLTGLSTGAFNLPANKIYKSGKTFKSTLAKAVVEVAKDCGAKVHVTKNKIFIRPKNEGDNIRYVINSERGLIGSPTNIEKEVVTGKDKAGNQIKKVVRGWKVKTLLNHRITTDVIIEIESKTANGTFRVESGKHFGGSKGTNFYTEMEVFPL